MFKNLTLFMCLSFAALSSCGDTQSDTLASAQTTVVDELPNNNKSMPPTLDLAESEVPDLSKNYFEMSPQLLAEEIVLLNNYTDKLRAEIVELGASGASRKEIYFVRKRLSEGMEALVRAEKAQTAADTERGRKIDSVTDVLKQD